MREFEEMHQADRNARLQSAEAVSSQGQPLRELLQPLLRPLLHGSLQPMWLCHAQTQALLEVNEAAEAFYGYDRETLLTMTLDDLRVDGAAAVQVTGDSDTALERHRRADGKIVAVEVTRLRLPADAPPLQLMMVRPRPAAGNGRAHATAAYGATASSPDLPSTALPSAEPARATLASRSERLYQALLEQAPHGVAVTDEHGDFIIVNNRACEMLGFAREKLLGRNLRQVIAYQDRQGLERALKRLVSDGETLRFEQRFVRSDGSDLICSVALCGLPDGGVQAILMDVSELRRAEEALRARERRFETLIQNSSDITCIADASGRTLYVSPSVARHLGYHPEERVGVDLFEDIHPDDLERVQREFQALLEHGGTRTVTHRYRDAAGEWRWMESIASYRLDDPDVAGIVVNSRDISKRIGAEQALRASEAFYRAVIEKSAEGIVLFGRNHVIRYASASIEKIVGFSDKELMGKHHLDFVHPEDRASLESVLGRLANRRSATVILEYRFRHQRGHWLWIEGTLTNLLHDPDVGAFVLNCRDVSDRKRAMEEIHQLNLELQRRVAHLNALRHVDMAITSTIDMRLVLEVFLDQVVTELGVDAANVLLFQRETQVLEPVASRGFLTPPKRPVPVRLGEGPAGRAALERRLVHEPSLGSDEVGAVGLAAGHVAAEAFVSYWAVPLVAKGELQGVLELYHRKRLEPDDDWFSFLDALADQGAIAVENAQLFHSLQRSNTDLKLAYDRTIEGWGRALDLKDGDTAGHSQRVTDMTVRLARYMGMSDEELVHVRRGALLHDIGKMGVPDSVLLKSSGLDEPEWEIMKRHTVYAYELLSPIDFLRPALDIPYCHHERWDGSGYPRGLKGDAIPLAARIFAVVDVYDALTSDRPYRRAWSPEKAQAYIREQAGRQFDPAVVEAFLAMLEQNGA